MRIDEIDLYGLWKINNVLGNSGEVISYTDGVLGWTAASNTPSTTAIKKSGYNYIIVETVNNGVDAAADAVTNGERLKQAYLDAQSLNVGTLGPDNRITLLLTPGDYDIPNTGLYLDVSYIDIVGMSTFAGHTILRSTTSTYTIIYASSVDSRLENIDLRSYSSGYISDNGGEVGQYLRWKNIIITGNYGQFEQLNGEFQDIVVNTGGEFPVALSSINGIYKNIRFKGSPNKAFLIGNSPGGSISGTYSNITFEGSLGNGIFLAQNDNPLDILSINLDGLRIEDNYSKQSFYSQNIYGEYKNIIVKDPSYGNGTGGLFFGPLNCEIAGVFKNIRTTTPIFYTVGISGLEIQGFFDNIVSYGGDSFYIPSGYILGTFSNVSLGDGASHFNTGTFSGYFENIEVGTVTSAFFEGGWIEGTYKNIYIQEGLSVFNAQYLYGNYEKIKVTYNPLSVVTGYVFNANNDLNGNYKDIEILNLNDNVYVFYAAFGSIDGTFENIKTINDGTATTGPIGIFSTQNGALRNIYGKYKNLKIDQCIDIFSTGVNIDIELTDCEFDSSTYAFYTTQPNSQIKGTYKNLKCLNTVASGQSIFVSSGITLDIEIENFNIQKNSSGGPFNCFVSAGQLIGTYKNLRLNYITNCFTSTATMSLIVDDFVIETYNQFDRDYLFKNSSFTNLMQGTFSNIEVNGSSFYPIFDSGGGFKGTFKNIRIDYLSTDPRIFITGNFSGSDNLIDNLVTKNQISGKFTGVMRNSSHGDGGDFSATVYFPIGPGTTIENCTIDYRYLSGPPDFGMAADPPGIVYLYNTRFQNEGPDFPQVGYPGQSSLTNYYNPSFILHSSIAWPGNTYS